MNQKKKLSRKVLSYVLALVMVLSTMTGIVPGMSMTAQAATEKTVAGLGTSAIINPTSTESSATAWAGSYVYYGKYDGTSPTKYRVLDKASNDFGVAGGSLLLDCDTTLYNAMFHSSNNAWSSSSLRSGLQGDAFLSKSGVFTVQEKGAIASSMKNDAAQNDGSGDDKLNYAALSGDTVFVLDAKEASRASYGYASNGTRKKSGTSAYGWWLRSPRKSLKGYAGEVYGALFEENFGKIVNNHVVNPEDKFAPGVSPAFNIKLSSVIFSSVITGTAGEAGTEYKLTLLDDKMSIALTSGQKVTKSGDTLTIPYTVSGDNAGNANQVSVLVTDKAYDAEGAAIKKYGKLADVNSSSLSGTGAFELPSELTGTLGTDYHIYLLAEVVNGEKETDYANLKEITVDDISSKSAQTVNPPTAATGLTYTDQEQALLTGGASVSEGNGNTEATIQYSLTPADDNSWVTGWADIKATNAGTYKVYYRVAGNDTYADFVSSDEQAVSVTIAKADPVTPTGMTGKYRQKLSTVSLPGGWSWADGDTIMSEGVGDYTYKANYNPTYATNYNSLSGVDLTVKVGKGDGTISFAKTEVESTIGVEPPYVHFENTGNGVVTFTSDKEDVATVDEDGDLTIIGVGETTITASVVDSATYQYATKSVSYKLIVNKRSTSIKTVPTASEITYGQTLAYSTLSGGEVSGGIEGTFSWVDSGVAPAVSDSETTEYAVKFTPKKSDIYAESTCKVKVKVKKAAAPATKESLLPEQKPATKNADDLVYTGEPIELVTAPTNPLGGYKVQYSKDNGTTWTDTIPTETNVGTYTVKVKYVSDNYENIDLDDITVKITPVSKEQLEKAVAAASKYLDTIKDNDDYSDVVSDLQNAINAANTTLQIENPTANQIGQAVKAINDAKAAAEKAVKDIDDTKAAQAVIDKINELKPVENIKPEDRTKIEAAREAYKKLSDDQKTKLTGLDSTAVSTLEAAEQALDTAEKAAFDAEKEAQKKAADALAAEGDSDASKKLIEDAKKAIDALAYDETKSLDENKKAVAAILTKLKENLTTQRAADKKEADDTAAAKKVTDAINALPASNKVATTDKAAIEAARKAYDALTPDQKKKVPADVLKKLTDAENALKAVEKDAADKAAADKVIEAINKLPASDKVATTDKAAIEAARKAYDALTADQKKKVPADVLKKLTDAEKALKAAEAAEKAAKELEAAKKEAQAAMNEQVTVKQKGKKFTVKWKKSTSADGYYVYASYCGKKATKPAKTVKKNTTTKVTISKINGKKISTKKNFHVYVVPYKIIDGKKVALGKSTVAHLVGAKSTKYSNVKKLTLKKTKYTVKVGKTAKIKAKVTLVNKNKKHIPKGHGAKLRYKSSDTSIATVSKNGKIKGIKKGKCTIYVYSINGLMKKAKITVK
jgi:hypothetical protein